VKRLVRRVILVVGVLLTVAVALLAIGSAAGRWRVALAPSPAVRATTPEGAVVLVVPVPAATLRPGDEFVGRLRPREVPHTYHVSGIVDARAREMRIRDDAGELYTGSLPNTVWRVRYAAPALGPFFDALLGPIQAGALVVLGLLLMLYADRERRRHSDAAEVT
jgi:hypothetical protein